MRGARCSAKTLLGLELHVHIENKWRLGDEVLAIPFYELVRARYPTAQITVSVNYPELLHGNSHVQVRSDLSEFDCDRYIFAKDDARSVSRLEHLCRAHGVPYRHIEPEVRIEENDALRRALPKAGLVVACSCGAGWKCKSWPAKHLRDTCAAIREFAGDVAFVEVGKDCERAGVGQDYTDKLSIAETAYAISRCRLYMGPDSGLAHLAAAVGIPTLVLCGPVDVESAFGRRKNMHAVLSPVACQGCWTVGRMGTPGICPLGITSDIPDDYPCMKQLTSERVVEAIRGGNLLEGIKR